MITHATMPLSGMERICVSRLLMMCARSLVLAKKPAKECGSLAINNRSQLALCLEAAPQFLLSDQEARAIILAASEYHPSKLG